MKRILEYKQQILRIEYKESKDLTYVYNGKEIESFKELFDGTEIELKCL